MTDQFTADGIRSNHPDVTLLDYVDAHGAPIHTSSDRVIFADRHGAELNEWADALDLKRSHLSARMRELARDVSEWNWSTSDPVVFNARTFKRDSFEQLAMLLNRGLSPAEAVDWLAIESKGLTQTDWSELRNVSQQNVSGNVSKARKKLNE